MGHPTVPRALWGFDGRTGCIEQVAVHPGALLSAIGVATSARMMASAAALERCSECSEAFRQAGAAIRASAIAAGA